VAWLGEKLWSLTCIGGRRSLLLTRRGHVGVEDEAAVKEISPPDDRLVPAAESLLHAETADAFPSSSPPLSLLVPPCPGS
jgi:hypothetical protein